MIGAIIGDVVGSRFEFNNIKKKDFELFANGTQFTDDTVMTIAVSDWATNKESLDNNIQAGMYLKKWGKKYPNAGYGARFIHWVLSNDFEPYYSCGNGSAMRISAVAHMFDDEQEMLKACRTITGITHNHPEGMKGAEVIAELIYKALHGASRKELMDYAIAQYPEIENLKYDELVETYAHDSETCQASVPQAIYCFLISYNFEDCLRTTISIGGDCDTTAAMSCAIAEAYYKEIPEYIYNETIKRLPEDMQKVIEKEYKDKQIRFTKMNFEKAKDVKKRMRKEWLSLERFAKRRFIEYLRGDISEIELDETLGLIEVRIPDEVKYSDLTTPIQDLDYNDFDNWVDDHIGFEYSPEELYETVMTDFLLAKSTREQFEHALSRFGITPDRKTRRMSDDEVREGFLGVAKNEK